MDGSEPVSRPFDAGRNGIILSEGAAVLVLEEEGHALDRGAEIIAVIKGCANAFDPAADRSFRHAGTGLADAIRLALKDASLNPEDIDYISACSNATIGLDRMETRAIKEVFGKHAFNISVSSVKIHDWRIFFSFGSSFTISSSACDQQGFVPPTMNYREQDPECDLDYVSIKPERNR